MAGANIQATLQHFISETQLTIINLGVKNLLCIYFRTVGQTHLMFNKYLQGPCGPNCGHVIKILTCNNTNVLITLSIYAGHFCVISMVLDLDLHSCRVKNNGLNTQPWRTSMLNLCICACCLSIVFYLSRESFNISSSGMIVLTSLKRTLQIPKLVQVLLGGKWGMLVPVVCFLL